MRSKARAAIRVATPRLGLAAVVCLGIVLFTSVSEASNTGARDKYAAAVAAKSSPSGKLPRGTPSVAVAAKNGIDQLIGLGGASPAAQNPRTGLWGGHTKPNWWQSALALLTLVRYLERTDNTQPVYQHHILTLYNQNHVRPGTHAPLNFGNEFNDDSGWWGVAWLEAARYELRVRHDTVDAAKFLKVAEWDANFIGGQSRRCGGIEWGMGKPPDTITTAEYMALTAGLAGYRSAPGVFHNPGKASKWLHDAMWALGWLKHSGMVDMKTGKIWDSLGKRCHAFGGPLTYSEGEVAEALIQIGLARHDPSYYHEAGIFLHYATSSTANLTSHGIIREKCEALKGNCTQLYSRLNIPAYKGLLVDAISDWEAVTKKSLYDPFLQAQARAVLKNAIISAGKGRCRNATTCLFGFYWVPPPHLTGGGMGPTLGSQESALDALTAALPARIPGIPN